MKLDNYQKISIIHQIRLQAKRRAEGGTPVAIIQNTKCFYEQHFDFLAHQDPFKPFIKKGP